MTTILIDLSGWFACSTLAAFALANMAGAIRGMRLPVAPGNIRVPIIRDIHQRVYEAASRPGALDMRDWHSPGGRAHCRAGWVVTLAGEQGRRLEAAWGTAMAAYLIYKKSDPEFWVRQNFWSQTDAEALAGMREAADAEKRDRHLGLLRPAKGRAAASAAADERELELA